MKNQIQKSSTLKDDQKFLQGINLVTGDKIDYTKHILTQTQVNAMCINQKLSKIDKFMHILTHGQKIQKWSIFQNLPYYIQNSDNAERIFTQVQKNYHEYEQFITIIGQGILKYLKKAYQTHSLINTKCCDHLYRIFYRTVTSIKYQGSDILTDWMNCITILFQFTEGENLINNRKLKLNDFKQYINGSFSMNTLPQRRKTALQLINSLLNLSQQIQKQAHNKIVFFNSDLNPSTRLVICNIMEKILLKNNKNIEIWKCVQDYYYTDKSHTIKQKSFQILSNIYYHGNSELIFQQFSNQQHEYLQIIAKFSSSIFLTFENELKKESMFQLKVISFLNRLLRKNLEIYITKVIESYKILIHSIPQSVLVQELQLNCFDLSNTTIIFHLIYFHSWISHLQFKDQIKKQIFKGIRYHEFDIKCDKKTIENLLGIFELTCQEDINQFTLLFGKQVDSSRWKNIQLFLEKIGEIKLYQNQYERLMGSIVKIYSNCPYFLIDKVHGVILYLMLNDRKNMEMYQKIKQKYINSRCWSHRRNYIKLYAYLKKNASYEFNRNFPPLLYKNILNDKNILIKQQFLLQFQQAYSYFDPTLQQEKNTIKEIVNKMIQDKDRELSLMAQNTLETMKNVDRDYELIHNNLVRNKLVYDRQIDVEQVQCQTKKHIKTQKVISKDIKDLKLKKLVNSDNKTSLNLGKLGNLDRNKPQLLKEPILSLKRSSSSQNKKDTLKVSLPTYKKSKF